LLRPPAPALSTLSLHDALPISVPIGEGRFAGPRLRGSVIPGSADWQLIQKDGIAQLDVTGAMLTDDGVTIRVSSKGMRHGPPDVDRKSTRLNSSHVKISYAVFC